MNGRTAKLLRKASGNDRQKYRLLKSLFIKQPRSAQAEARRQAIDLAEIQRQQAVVNERLVNEIKLTDKRIKRANEKKK